MSNFNENDKSKVDLNWSPPSPPWEPEPEPLELSHEKEEVQPEDPADPFSAREAIDAMPTPLTMYNGALVDSEFSEFDSKDNGIRVGDFFFYMIMSPQGITRNGVFYDMGGHWFDEETYGSIEIIDLPFQE